MSDERSSFGRFLRAAGAVGIFFAGLAAVMYGGVLLSFLFGVDTSYPLDDDEEVVVETIALLSVLGGGVSVWLYWRWTNPKRRK